MIERDLLGISVSDLINNYLLLYDHVANQALGIVQRQDVEKIDNEYGMDYEEQFIFVDILQGGTDLIKEGYVLTYYELQKKLERFVGWQPNPDLLMLIANCVYANWLSWSTENAQYIINMLKIIKAHQFNLNSDEISQVVEVQDKIDEWRKDWESQDIVSNEIIENATEILKTLKEEGVDL